MCNHYCHGSGESNTIDNNTMCVYREVLIQNHYIVTITYN